MSEPARPSLRPAVAALVLLGLSYAAFSALLHRAGTPARAVLLPIPARDYYAWQAWFVGPWLALLASIHAHLAFRWSGARSAGARSSDAWALLAPRYALGLLVGFVLPDLLVFLWAGSGALARAMRVYGPVAPLLIVWSSIGPLRRLGAPSTGRAVVGSTAALVVQALVGALLLR